MDADRYNQIVGSVLDRDDLFLSPQSLLATRWLVEPGISDKYVPADAVRMLALVPYVRYDGKRTLRYTEHKLQYDALTGSAVIDQRSQLAVLDADYCGKRQRKRWQCDHTMRYAQHVVHMMEALLRAADGNFLLHESPPMPAVYLVEDQRRPLQPEIGNRFLRGAAIDRYALDEEGAQPTHDQQRESFYQYAVETPRGRAYPQILFYRSLNKTYEYCPATGTAHPPVAPSAGTTIGNWMTYGNRWIPKAQLPRLTLLDMASSNLFMNEFQNPAVRLLQQYKFLPPGDTITQEDIDAAIHALDALIDGPLTVWREADLVPKTGRISDDDIARVGRLLTAHPQLRTQLTENFRAKFMDPQDEYPSPVVAQQDIDASITHPTRRMSILAQLYDTFRAEAVAANQELGQQLSMAEILKALRNPLSPGVASGLPTTQVVQLRGYAAKETLAWIEPWSVLDLGSMYKFEEQYVPSDYHSVKKGTHAKSGKSPVRTYDGARG